MYRDMYLEFVIRSPAVTKVKFLQSVKSHVLDTGVIGNFRVCRAQIGYGKFMHIVIARQSCKVHQFLRADFKEVFKPARGLLHV